MFHAEATARKAARSKQKMQEERNRLEAAHAAGLVSHGKPVAAFARAKSDKAAYLDHGIKAVQSSTASVGRFDRQLDKEPSRTKGQRRSYGSDTVAEHRASDASSAKRVAERIFPDASSNRSARADVVRSSSTALKMARRDEESACTTVSLLWRSTRSKIAPVLRSDSATPKLLSTSAFDVPPDKYDSSTMTSNVARAASGAVAAVKVQPCPSSPSPRNPWTSSQPV